jgi:predicted ATP-grasp superfamily ATP-dependent carboligase
VELLYSMYCDAIGWPLPPNLEQKYTGAKWIHLRRDSQSALYYWRRGELTLKEWWRSIRGRKTYALFSWTDPAPFFGDLVRVIRTYLQPEERKERAYRNL